MRRVKPRKGYHKLKVQCPACGRMVKGHMALDEHRASFGCKCGAVLDAMVYRCLEFRVEDQASA